jgi:hypothetical protein
VDIVLGVSMAPAMVRMVLVEGENADGALVEEDSFDIASDHDAATLSAANQVITAILGTREGADEAGYQLLSTGVTWTDPLEAAALRDALVARKIENVMLVSAFLAAAALAQTFGAAMGYAQTAMLFVEPDSATVGVVNCDDGSVTEVRREVLSEDDDQAITELAALVSGVEALQSRPQGVFVVGSGVDIPSIKPALEAATSLPVSAAEEPQMALARGAALASANAPLFASSTVALAYAQDPGTGEVDPYALAGYFSLPDVSAGGKPGDDDLAYSAVPSEDAEADTVSINTADDAAFAGAPQGRRPVLLASTVLAVIAVTAVVALEIALGIGIRPTVALRPNPGQDLIVPAQQAPAPAPTVKAPAPQPIHMPMNQPAPVSAVAPPAPPPAAPPVPAPVAPPVPVPVAPVPVPLPILVPAPAAPAPVPVPQAHVAVPAAPIRMPAPQPPVQAPNPQPPVHVPTPPVHVPTSPVQQPVPPVHVPTPPVHVPTPPVQVPTPPVHVPTPPVHVPTPPVQQPVPPVQVPAPPVHVPTPPVQQPVPPVHVPTPPAQQPVPGPPVHLSAPTPPMNLPAPEPPVNLPPPVRMSAPEPPPVRAIPAPAMPQLPQVFAPRVQGPSLSPGGGFGGGLGGHGFGGGGFGGGFGGGGFGGHR